MNGSTRERKKKPGGAISKESLHSAQVRAAIFFHDVQQEAAKQ
jgi:hypothetical protein